MPSSSEAIGVSGLLSWASENAEERTVRKHSGRSQARNPTDCERIGWRRAWESNLSRFAGGTPQGSPWGKSKGKILGDAPPFQPRLPGLPVIALTAGCESVLPGRNRPRRSSA